MWKVISHHLFSYFCDMLYLLVVITYTSRRSLLLYYVAGSHAVNCCYKQYELDLREL